MEERNVDIAIIGGGPAGLAAALAAKGAGIDDVLIIEREARLGGILNQCIHHGFGIEVFKESLTGPEYMSHYIAEVGRRGIECWTDSMVIDMSPGRRLTVCRRDALTVVQAKTVVLCMGCRERTRGAISIPGSRPSGIYTAGVAQNFINLKNLMVGKKIVILGSGDVGLIMARRLTLEGACVLAVVEILPYSSGLPRNIQQCLRDFDIPLYLSHTVVDIEGKKRLSSVTIAEVDEELRPIAGTERKIGCDTLLLSVGLIPENELSLKAGIELDGITGGAVVNEDRETSVEGIFACGNVLHVHDIVDFVSREAEIAGRAAARHCLHGKNGSMKKMEGFEELPFSHSKPHQNPLEDFDCHKPRRYSKSSIRTVAGRGIRYVLPHYVSGERDVTSLFMRVQQPGRNRFITVKDSLGRLIKKTPNMARLVPSGMVQLELKKEELGDAKELIVMVEEK